MKYTIHWLEVSNPESVCDELGIDSNEIDEVENPENYKRVLKEVLSWLPPNSKHTGELMGDWEFECSDIISANSIEEAKKEAEEYDVEVFTVNDEQGNKVFDDVDVYETGA